MQLLIKDKPVLNITEDGKCTILDFDRLPFALRKENISFVDFMEWASNRTLSIGRTYAKEILNSLRLSQTNHYAVCRACRGLSLEDSYWIRQEGDTASWREINLFENPLTLFITELSLSGQNINYQASVQENGIYRKPAAGGFSVYNGIHTPELTTLGASAKGWIRHGDGLHLHKVGKYEIPAAAVLDAIGVCHIPYFISNEQEIDSYLSEERKSWLDGVEEKVVNTKLFTSEDTALVTFEEFRIFCEAYGMNPFEEAAGIDRLFYLKMQIADYLLHNNDRHEQNWGFLMDSRTGKLTGFCPLFDHDHAFCSNANIISQTTEQEMTLREAAETAQREVHMELENLFAMERPLFLNEKQWESVLERGRILSEISG